MDTILLKFPSLVLPVSFIALWLSAQAGALFAKRRPLPEDLRDDFGVVQAAALTLLGLLIGFTFSMAITRYDQRKTYEEEEANAIGTEYVRADLLPAADAAKVRELLRNYLDQRVLGYTIRNAEQRRQIGSRTAQLQDQMWSTLQPAAAAHPTPTVALALSGMNDVLNSQGYTQAAWRNRIPVAAWGLVALIAMCCNLLIGYGARRINIRLFAVLPLAVSIAFFLIVDIDSPLGGLIRVQPQNLVSLVQSLQGH